MAENQNIEWKESWRDEYLKWICGFANAQGGVLNIGINDNGVPVGLKDTKSLMEEIPNKIVTLLGIVADVNLQEKDGIEYIEIVVPKSNMPIAYKGVYHYRSGSTKQELRGQALQDFLLKKLGMTWDDMVDERASLDDINPEAVAYFQRIAVANKRMAKEAVSDDVKVVLDNLNLINESGQIKKAALLLFGKKPEKFVSAPYFRIGRFRKDDTDLLFQDSVECDLIRMADRVVELLKSKYLISPIHYEGLQRIEDLEVPEDALREAIFNAIIHKDYSGAHIQMKVWDDRIEIWNDGGLPYDMSIEKLLGQHSSKPRNVNIASVFYKAGFIESWGRGILKIQKGFEDAGMKAPLFEEDCGGVRVTLYRNVGISASNEKNVQKKQAEKASRKNKQKKQAEKTSRNGQAAKTVENKKKILDFLRDKDESKAAEIGEHIGLSSARVRVILSELAEDGKILAKGDGKSRRYMINSKN
ncbi:MAG: putative DNA binding domain-containing protein [Lachnospiraceae bacterium]|nr:putative DNA binding domain-containing protein [Lachnospiraceae bacterium]